MHVSNSQGQLGGHSPPCLAPLCPLVRRRHSPRKKYTMASAADTQRGKCYQFYWKLLDFGLHAKSGGETRDKGLGSRVHDLVWQTRLPA